MPPEKVGDFRNQNRRIILRSGLGGLYKLVGTGLGFAVVLVLAMKTNAVEFGLYSIGFSIASLVWPLVTAGQSTLAVRFWPTLSDRYNVATANFVLLRALKIVFGIGTVVIGGSALLNLVVPSLGITEFTDGMIIWTAVFAVSLGVSQFSAFALRAQGMLHWSILPKDIAWRLLVITIAVFSSELNGVQALSIVALCLSVVTLLQIMRMVLAIGSLRDITSPPREDITAMQRAEWALCGGEISRQWLQQAATFVVAIMLGPVSAGAFFAAQRLANLLSIGLIGTNQVSGPAIARSWRAGQFQRLQSLITTISIAALTFSLIGFGFYWIWGAWLLAQFDRAFSDAHIVLLCLAFGQLVNAACGPNGHLLNLAGQEKATLYISIVAGVANIVCTAIGITFYGLIGAAIGSTIATILWNVWCTNLCAKRLNIHLFNIQSCRQISGIRTSIFPQKAIKK